MRLATLRNDTLDGKLVKIAPDGRHYAEVFDNEVPVPTMQTVLEQRNKHSQLLIAIDDYPHPLNDADIRAPLPRAWQWLDGSAYESHGDLMQVAFGLDPISRERPLMYQGVSDTFYAATDDIPFARESDGIDFEGEFGVIVDYVPMGTTAEQAMDHIRLIVQINDWSLRTLAPVEMKTGFGWIQAKPPCSVAPFALTPDELGAQWKNGRVCLDLEVEWNGEPFGRVNGEAMAFGFHELVAHAAATRHLVAGTIIGSGTVSNSNYREVGSSCISERRAIEMVDHGEALTPYMSFGDTVRMTARNRQDAAPFGAIRQTVVSG